MFSPGAESDPETTPEPDAVAGKDPTDQQDALDLVGSGSVRWRRFAAMMAASTAAGLALVLLTANGVLAAQFSISGLPFIVTATQLKGTGFEQFATLDSMPPNSPNAGDTGGQMILIVSAIRDGTMTNLCQSVAFGAINLKLTAGTGKDPVHVTNMVADSDQLDGDISFTDIEIGQDASTLSRVPGAQGNLGVFGQQAGTITINNFRQRNYAVSAASFTLPDLRMRFTPEGC
jgi:hypothetical protein